ncbi:MAG: hypothetical protein Q8P91_01995 [bacterium]|nr:hypothetical protein [bacterium]
MLFDLEKFNFPIRILPEGAGEGKGDYLWFRFRFQEFVGDEKMVAVKRKVRNWFNKLFDAQLANYMEYTYPKWYTKKTLCVLGVDTGGNEPNLTRPINALIHEMNEIAPLKEVEITAE